MPARERLPVWWIEVSSKLLRYVTCEWRAQVSATLAIAGQCDNCIGESFINKKVKRKDIIAQNPIPRMTIYSLIHSIVANNPLTNYLG